MKNKQQPHTACTRETPTDRIFRPQEAARKLGITRPTLYAWVRLGILSKPIKLGPQATGWRESTLDAFIDSRAQQ